MRSAILTSGCLIWAAIRPDAVVPTPYGIVLLVAFALFGLMDGIEFAANFKKK